jgi:hypothetical protein
MPRALLLVFLVATFVSAALLAAGCLDSAPMSHSAAPDAAAPLERIPVGAGNMATTLEQRPVVDMAPHAPQPDLLPPPPPDLRPSDLAGLTNCYDKTYCDSATMMCVRFFNGSPGKPGGEKLAPSCYSPNDPCPNGTLDCTCIQQDAVLGPSCAQCFNNQDGTFTCYAMASQ